VSDIDPCSAVEGYARASSSRHILSIAGTTSRTGHDLGDNFTSHKGQWLRELVEACGCSLPYESSRAARGLGVTEARRARSGIPHVLHPVRAGAKALDWVTLLWA
jgi:hypothetical protein